MDVTKPAAQLVPPNDSLAWPVPMLLDVRDVSRLCKVDRHEAASLMHRAGPVRLGRRLRVRPQDLDRLLERMAQGQDT